MKLSTREDIEAPIDAVYAAVTDFDAFERGLMKRGIDVVRESEAPVGVGTVWHATPSYRGRPYEVTATLMALEPGQGFTIESHASGLICLAVVDLVALSKSRTRMFAALDLRPTTMSSRVMLHSLKLAKGGLTRRFKERVSGFASGVAEA